jgi:hypothetical protein
VLPSAGATTRGTVAVPTTTSAPPADTAVTTTAVAPIEIADPVIIEPVVAAATAPSAVRPRPAEVVRVVRNAAEPFAFPIALVVAVGAFLLVQGHIDRRDPKLADEPEDELHFG